MSLLLLDVPCDPIPCPRPRVSRFGTYYPAKYRSWRKEFSEALTESVEANGWDLPLRGALGVEIEFRCLRPRTSKLDHPKPDIDNYIKSVLDGANGILWDDDSQIIRIEATKSWQESPGIGIRIAEIRIPPL